tara:strand:- start:4478 stop:4906 length:429 start_codon:yes stop_codon:yes gene_type:complete
MKIIIPIIVISAFYSCIYDSSLKPVIPNHLITANSAKTWVQTEYTKHGESVVPHLSESRFTYTFYDNGTFREQRLIHLGSKKGKKGNFSWKVSEENDTIISLLYYGAPPLSLNIESIDTKIMRLANDSISMTLETLQPPKLK